MKLLKLVPDNTNIRFLRWRVPFYAISLLLMAASLALVFTKGLNLGVDFLGGHMVRVSFVQSKDAPVSMNCARALDALGYGEAHRFRNSANRPTSRSACRCPPATIKTPPPVPPR